MQIRHLLTTMIFAIALMLGIVACAPAASTTPTPPTVETGGSDDAEPSGDTGTVDDSNGLEMNSLVGTWQVVDITAEPVVGPLPLSLSFVNSGEVAGNGGCNGFGGTYKADATTLSIVGVVSTMMACEDQTLMSQETNLLGTLELVSTYTVDGDTLTLFDTDGNAILTLSRLM